MTLPSQTLAPQPIGTAALSESHDIVPDIPWTELRDPPAPTGINQFPSTPHATTVAHKNLKGHHDWQTIGQYFFGPIPIIYRFERIRLSVMGRWHLLTQGTATVNTPFSHEESYTVGTSNADTFTVGLSTTVSAGIASIVELSATLSAEFSHTQTFTKSQTTTNYFKIEGTDEAPQLSACWWQGTYDYTLHTGLCSYSIDNGRTFIPMTKIEAGNAYIWHGFPFQTPGKWEMTNHVETFVSTQYPAI